MDWTIKDNKVVVIISLPSGGTLHLTRDDAKRFGEQILRTVESSPKR